MTIWFSLDTVVNVKPDVDDEKLAAALAAIEECVPDSVYQDGHTIAIEASHDMTHTTAKNLEAVVKQLAHFTDEAICVTTKYEDDDSVTYVVGQRAAVVEKLKAEAARRMHAIEEHLAREVGRLTVEPPNAFVESEAQ